MATPKMIIVIINLFRTNANELDSTRSALGRPSGGAGLGSGEGIRVLEPGVLAGCLGHAGTQAETGVDPAAGCGNNTNRIKH